MNSKLKMLILLIVLLIGGYFGVKTIKHKTPAPLPATPSSESRTVKIIETNPPSLDGATILPSQDISITFSAPLQNAQEFKSTMDPQFVYTTTLSSDKKTVRISPVKAYGFDQQYSFHISKDTKFEGDKKLENDTDFHFGTVSYSGA